MNNDITYKIRPAGRHILTIGRDLIQDNYAAVIELVKNAYDADSPQVDVEFKKIPNLSEYSIVISDHGHGMSRDDIINKWLVPSTEDKIKRGKSPAGRILQGSKGVGRYAASILGNNLHLETVTNKGEKTTVYVEWDKFEVAQYLDDVEIQIKTAEVSEPSGTVLTINGNDEYLKEWDKKRFEALRFELKKLTSPMSSIFNNEDSGDNFRINLRVEGFSGVENVKETIEPFPIYELFDYKISGTIDANGDGVLTYSNQRQRNRPEEKILFNNGANETGCGKLDIDIRVFDREAEAISALSKRGLEKHFDSPFGKLEARQLLNHYNGVGVYRNGFRIRPLGDAGYDWLKLNARRVNNPSMKVGSNQVIGYVQIQSEDESGLIEKSARDGLKENIHFNRLQDITKQVIEKLEIRRFKYRKSAGLSRSTIKVGESLQGLFSSQELIENVKTHLQKDKVNKKTLDKTIEFINQDTQEKNKIVDDIQTLVAIYQVDATLGKIVGVILHEGSKPLSYFSNQLPNLNYWFESYQETSDPIAFEKILRIVNGMVQNADVFVKLFRRLDPLAARRSTVRKPLPLKKTIQGVCSIFEKEMETNNISVEVRGPDDLKYSARIQDIYSIFTNLIDNSIYWIREKNTEIRKIIIEFKMVGSSLRYIDYYDTGPGIVPEDIESEMIFAPGFTNKPDGTGLGLSIAGEAAARNDLRLEVYEADDGAHFRLQPKKDSEK
ncbi:MAG: sensor histidine kinase [Candidatus Poribacteria bacterium]|nr:sensor histidine kinase [Candidatus Poribacteria bacterium]